MEFFCELWIRWNINISLEYFEIYSGREGGKKKRKNIDRSIRLLYRTPLFLVQRITQKMGDGLFGDYYRRGQKGGEKRKMEGKL